MNKKMNCLRQVCYADRVTVNSGKSDGLKLIYCAAGKLGFILNESKCLDVASLSVNGENVSFISKNGFTNQQTGFLKNFGGGMLYTCGLDAIGDIKGHLLHGLIHNIPAENVVVSCTDEKLVITGEMRDSALFGENLLLKRTITAYTKETKLEISDELVNESYRTEKYCLLYHVNFGYPFLGENTVLETNAKEIIPRTEKAAKNMANVLKLEAPVDNEEEECFFHNGATAITVRGENSLKATVSYTGDMFGFIEWKSFASGDYALGIEPATSALDGYFEYKTVEPSETKKYGVTISFE